MYRPAAASSRYQANASIGHRSFRQFPLLSLTIQLLALVDDISVVVAYM